MRGWACLVLLLLLPVAGAHSTAYTTDPVQLGGLPEAPFEVRLIFTEPMLFEESKIAIFDQNLLRVDNGDSHVTEDPHIVAVPTGHLPDGIYTFSYETVSAVDGHLEKGSIAMSIGVPCTICEAAQEEGPWFDAAAALKALYFAGLAVALGALWLGLSGPWHPAAWFIAAAVGAAGLAATDPRDGLYHGLRLGAVLVAASTTGRPGVSAAAALVSIVAHGALGHGSATTSGIVAVSLHMVFLLPWVGAVALLGLARHRDAGDAAIRTSRLATVSLVTLALTATMLTLQRLPSLDALWTSRYGNLLAAKTGLVAVVVAFGWWHHRRIKKGQGLQKASVRWEALGMAAILLVTASLSGQSVPTSDRSDVYVDSASWMEYDLRIEISPANAARELGPGEHLHRVRIVDLDGKPVTGAHVTMAFRSLIVNTGQIVSPAKEVGRGWYETQGTQLGAVGPWEVEITWLPPGAPAEREGRFRVDVGNVGHLHGFRIGDPHFASPYLEKGESYSRVFTERGTFSYHCHPHPWMEGKVIVDPEAAAAETVHVAMYGDRGDEPGQMYFDPPHVTVRPGTTVVWTNLGTAPHTATNTDFRAA